jgi:hypothetical protein
VRTFENGLDTSLGKQSAIGEQQWWYDTLHGDTTYELIRRTSPTHAGNQNWSLENLTVEVYRNKYPPKVPLDARKRPLTEKDYSDGGTPTEEVYWLAPESPNTVYASKTTVFSGKTWMEGLLKWTPGPTAALASGVSQITDPVNVIVLAPSSVERMMAADLGSPDHGLYGHPPYDPDELLEQQRVFTGVSGQLQHAFTPPFIIPILDKLGLRAAGFAEVQLPRSLPAGWQVADATWSPSPAYTWRVEYEFDGSRSVMTVSFADPSRPSMQALLVQRPARVDDGTGWRTAHETVRLGKVAVELIRMSGVAGDSFVSLVGHGVAEADLAFVREQLKAFPVS